MLMTHVDLIEKLLACVMLQTEFAAVPLLLSPWQIRSFGAEAESALMGGAGLDLKTSGVVFRLEQH
jgi:hypothetical protein